MVGSRGIVELMLPTLGSTLNIPVIFGIIDVEILVLLGLHVLHGNNPPFDSATNHHWNRIITNRDPHRVEEMWKI